MNKIAIPKKAYLLSFFSRHYHKVMKLKCKAHRYLSLFCCNCVSHISFQGTWADALIIQAVADALKVTIQIVKSNQGFAPLSTVYPVQERKYFYNYYRSYWWMPLCINQCLTIKCLHFNVQGILSHQEISILLCPLCSLFLCLQIMHLLGFFNTTSAPWTCMYVQWEV